MSFAGGSSDSYSTATTFRPKPRAERLTLALFSSPLTSFSFTRAPGYTGRPTSRTSASLLTWIPPSGVSMSTFFSSPPLSFLTLTLQAGRRSKAANAATKTSRELMFSSLGLRMLRVSLCGLRRPLDSSAAVRDVWNTHRQAAAEGNFTEQRFNRADFRNRGIGKSTKIILHRREVLRQVWIPHGEDDSFLRRVIQNLLQQCAAGVGEGYGVGQTVRAFHCPSCCGDHVHGGNHCPRLVHGFQDIVGEGGRDARIDVDHVGIRHTNLDLALEHAAGFSTHVLGKNHRDEVVVHFFHSLIRKTALHSSRLFQWQKLAIVADQSHSVVRDLLA